MHLIRQATHIDLKLIAQWTLQLHQHEDDGELSVKNNFSEKLFQWLDLEMKNPHCLFLIAEVNTLPAGFIFAYSSMNENNFLESLIKGKIQILWVDEKHRRLNIAQSLVDQVIACFKELDIQHIECSYTAKNTLAQSFWKSQGFNESSITSRKRIK